MKLEIFFILCLVFVAVFFIGSLAFGFFPFANTALAVVPPPPPPPPEPDVCQPGPMECSTDVSPPFRCDDFSVYRCVNDACGKNGGAMEQGMEWYTCQTTSVSCSDGCDSSSESNTERIGGPDGPDQIRPYGKVGEYQRCLGSQDWTESAPTPVCSGSCYPAPNLKPLGDPSLAPKNVSENSQYKLPMNFGWEDNVKKEVAKAPNFCTVGSYDFSIPNAPLSQITTDTQIQRVTDPAYNLQCQLKSDTAYSWQVRACLDSGGTDCGDWSTSQDFNTSLAPEPVSPYDSDWEGVTSTKNVVPPVTLDWCDVKDAGSYRFKVYVIEGGQKVCHPDLLSNIMGEETCDSWLLRKTRRNPEQIDKTLYSDFLDENMKFFTKNTTSSWQVATCDENGFNCGDYSQLWTFNTQEITLATSSLVSPTNDPTGKTPVGLPLILDWSDKPGVNSFIYEVVPAAGGQKISETTNVSQSKTFDYPQFSLNTLYKWKVKSCWDYQSKKCEPNFSEEWYFKTTGRAPSLTYPAANEQSVVIPVNFSWENVPGAKSYIFKISGSALNLEKTLDKPEFSLDFPEYPIHQETNYSWQVKTCAWTEGKTCGYYSNPQTFETFRLPPPQKPSPENNGQFYTGDKYVSWEKVPGAKAYQYQIKYVSLAEKETDQTCPALVGKDVFSQPKLALANSDFTELKCLGGYQWQVRSCLDNNCREVSNWSNDWSFTLVQGGTGQNGLVPCGQLADNPKTPWNEREPCQIKHLFLEIKIIFDFLLLRVIPIILVLLTIATAFIFYTSFGNIMTMSQVISLWKAAGIGLAIIFFAWTIINIFLKVIGYNIGIFGNWYQLPM